MSAHLEHETLWALSRSELDTAARTAAEQHLAGCPDCRVSLEDVKLAQGVLMDLPPVPAMPDAMARRVGQQLAEAADARAAKHFTSWLCLAPGNKISGGKVLSSRTRRSGSRAAAALRLAATTVGKTDTALGAFYRRLSARTGKAKAVTATARKIAVLFYNALRHGMQYQDPGASYYEERYRQRVLDGLRRRASSLGYTLQQQAATVNGVS